MKKKIPLPLLILLIGLGIGVVVAGFGLIKQESAKKTNEERYKEAYKLSQEKVDAANKRYAEIIEELKPLNEKLQVKNQECNSMNMSDSNWFVNVNKCRDEASAIRSEINELESEQFKLKNDNYTVYYTPIKPMSYQIFYIIGGSIFVLAALGAFIIYLVKGKKTY